MAESILWATLIIASASLVFAFIAFRQVMRTSRSVDGFIQRADNFLSHFKAQAKGIFSPDFVADTVTKVLTKDIRNPDGSPVSMPQFINGYIVTYGPGLKEEFKKELPNIMTHLLNPQNPPPPGPSGPQSPGQALAQQRWGTGGLKAASKVAKAAKKVPLMGKVGEAVETARDLVALKGTIVELKNELFPAKGDNGGDSAPAQAGDQSQLAWGPPY